MKEQNLRTETIYALPAADAIHKSIIGKRNGYDRLVPCESRTITGGLDPCNHLNKTGTPVCLYADNKDDIGTKGLIYTASGLECPLQRGKLQVASRDKHE